MRKDCSPTLLQTVVIDVCCRAVIIFLAFSFSIDAPRSSAVRSSPFSKPALYTRFTLAANTISKGVLGCLNSEVARFLQLQIAQQIAAKT